MIYTKLDFNEIANGNTIRQSKLPMLEVIFDKFARRVSGSLRATISNNIEGSTIEQKVEKFSEAVERHIETVAIVFKITEWGSSALMLIEKDLAFHILDAMLGGKINNFTLPKRAFTSIENNLIEMLAQVILNDLHLSFQIMDKTTIVFDRLESKPSLAQIVRNESPTVEIGIKLDIEQRKYSGQIFFLFPQSTLKAVKNQLQEIFIEEKTQDEDPSWEEYISKELKESTCNLQAVLSKECMTLSEISKWAVGKTIPLRANENSLVELYYDNTLLFKGRAGHKHNIINISIEEINKKIKGDQ